MSAVATFTDKARRLDRVRLILKRRYGEVQRPLVTHPVEHAARAILSEGASRAQVDRAVERLRRDFVGWNDLRVSRPREIRESLGADFPDAAYKARVIPRLLDQVFKRHNSMVWDFLEETGKLQTRVYFEGLEEVRPFVAATIARDCAGAHAFPVDRDVARVLGRLGVLDPQTQSEPQMQTFLERAVRSSRIGEAHQLIKRLAEDLCLADAPRCGRCPASAMCPSVERRPKRKPSKRKKAKRTGAGRPKKRTKARAARKK